jgi:hypothetical protein
MPGVGDGELIAIPGGFGGLGGHEPVGTMVTKVVFET